MVLTRLLQSLGGSSSSTSTAGDDSSTTDKTLKLPFKVKRPSSSTPTVQLYPFAPDSNPDGLIVKIEPPQKPTRRLNHVPCDLVLCIDVSGSMGCEAPMPVQADGAAREDSGLSVLDLVKHAARTILETLDHQDRLGIVTFSCKTKVSRRKFLLFNLSLEPRAQLTEAGAANFDVHEHSEQGCDSGENQ